jgi:hypothetical protein
MQAMMPMRKMRKGKMNEFLLEPSLFTILLSYDVDHFLISCTVSWLCRGYEGGRRLIELGLDQGDTRTGPYFDRRGRNSQLFILFSIPFPFLLNLLSSSLLYHLALEGWANHLNDFLNVLINAQGCIYGFPNIHTITI